jgi:hypothetical protein
MIDPTMMVVVFVAVIDDCLLLHYLACFFNENIHFDGEATLLRMTTKIILFTSIVLSFLCRNNSDLKSR